MEVDRSSPTFLAAIRDFRRARQRAVLQDILAHLTGKPDNLLAYDEVHDQLRLEGAVNRGLQQIPVAAIVGSVGRYADFTRSFLPRQENDEKRWAEVQAVVTETGRIPPIAVYKIDQAYFVLDGNHRVSVARRLGYTHIPAYVTEVETNVPLTPEVQPDELICKAKYAEFLEKTHLHELRPQADLSVTAPGQYRHFEQQIETHRQRLTGLRRRRVSFQEAVLDWYDKLYLPVIRLIRERGILRHFPGRTETDLYAWIVRHQTELREALGWEVEPGPVAQDLVSQFSPKPDRILARLKEKVLELLTPPPFEAGPPPGQWRREQIEAQHEPRLFGDILVAISGEPISWQALEQALIVARREEGRLYGLHVLAPANRPESKAGRALRAEFQRRCQAAHVAGEFSFTTGHPPRQICDRARWVDLVVLGLADLPRPQPGDRLISGFGRLARSCPRPILAVPGQAAPLKSALLAYDGSPKAKEALFVAAYLAGRWQVPLVVLSVLEEDRVTPAALQEARDYLAEHRVQASFVTEHGTIAWAIIRTAMLYEVDFIVMGGYGLNPVMEVILGSEVDQILRARRWPVLICR